MDDRELNHLLREWKAPDAPPSLQPPAFAGRVACDPTPSSAGLSARIAGRPAGHPRRMLSWLLTGSIRIPVPVGIAVVVLAAYWAYTASTLQAPGIDSTPEFTAPVVSLADFTPVEEVEVRVVGDVK